MYVAPYAKKLQHWFEYILTPSVADGISFFTTLSEGRDIFISSIPPNILGEYVSNQLFKHDPRMHKLKHALVPFIWNLEEMDQTVSGQKKLYAFLKTHNFLSGMVLPLHAGKRGKGCLTFCFKKTAPDPVLDVLPIMQTAPLAGYFLTAYTFALDAGKEEEINKLEAEMEEWHSLNKGYQIAKARKEQDNLSEALFRFSEWLSTQHPLKVDTAQLFAKVAEEQKYLVEKLYLQRFL